MAKKKSTLRSDVRRLVNFKKSLGLEASFNDLFEHYKSKGRTGLDKRSFRETDDKGRFFSNVDYTSDEAREILNFAKSKAQESRSKADLREVTQKARIDYFQKRAKESPEKNIRDFQKELEEKQLFSIDTKSRIIYNSAEANLEAQFKKNPNLKMTIVGTDGEEKTFTGKKGLLDAQKFQSDELSKGWQVVREQMKKQIEDELKPIENDRDFNKGQLEIQNSLKSEGLRAVFDDEGNVVRTVKASNKEIEKEISNLTKNVKSLNDDIKGIKGANPTPSKSVPTTAINDITGKPIAVKVNYSDIRGGAI